MLIFFDTEFTDLAYDAKLISIGLVDETGERTFYAELSDTWGPYDPSDFVEEEVLPKLGNPAARIPMDELRRQLASWLASFGQPVQLATDSLAWDWPWIVDLFGMPGGVTWPECLAPKACKLLILPEFQQAVEDVFAAGLRRHHALDDAEANRMAWLATQWRRT
ncbi:MAG: 3'-5' exoribonuclease [Rhodocyclaceae bacterium]|nr:3'-5' exoribonuclease [Rhodocyclaceae bacterium]